MLQNENSAYYTLLREVVLYTDSDRLFTFGMNLGYNGCTIGAGRIRENEKKLSCNISWALVLQIDTEDFDNKKSFYHIAVLDGENLGIYVWMLFLPEHPEKVLTLVKNHKDSAFCIFCRAEDLSPEFLDGVSELHNLMLVIRYDENACRIFPVLRKMGCLYSMWYQYGVNDLNFIKNGELFQCTQQYSPLFTILLATPDCPKTVQNMVHETVIRARNAQTYHTLLWELQSDNSIIDSIISDDDCSVYFDKKGEFHTREGKMDCRHHNLFQDRLSEIFKDNCSKKMGGSPASIQRSAL